MKKKEKKSKKKSSLFKKILLLAFILFTLGLLFTVGIFYYYSINVYGEKDLKTFNPNTTLRIYDRNDKLIALYYYSANSKKTIASYENIPKKIINTIIAVEDSSFFEHSGLDYLGILRAIVKDIITMSAKQGASTITQQVAKNLLLSNEKKLSRKIKEAILAKRIEKILSKEEIMSLYLNNIYFGGGNYGIVEAARYYFNKDLKKLNSNEIAYLMGLPKNPNGYNLKRFPSRGNKRKDFVLTRMLKKEVIDRDEFNKYYKKDLEFIGGSSDYFHPGAYFASHILKILKEKYGNDFIYHKSLAVKTTIDIEAQKEAIKALKSGLNNLNKRQGILRPIRKNNDKLHKMEGICKNCEEIFIKDIKKDFAYIEAKKNKGVVFKKDLKWVKKFKPFLNYYPKINKLNKILKKDFVYLAVNIGKNKLINNKIYPIYKIIPVPQVQGALVSIDVDTREVISLVGGYDFKFSQFNRATQSVRQAGSVFKPFIYSAAVKFLKDRKQDTEKGVNDYTPSRIVFDTPVSIINRKTGAVWKPMNFSKMKFSNEIMMKDALRKSINMVSIKLFSKYIDRMSRISEDNFDIEKGFSEFFNWLSSFGLTTDNMQKSYQLSLGATEVNLLEMVSAYAVFPSYGIYKKPKLIISIKDIDSNEYYKDEREPVRVMQESEAYLMVDMMREVVNSGTARRAKKLGWPIGGKTGTTNMQRNAWFIGYTKNIVTGVWVGFDNRTPMGSFVQGGRTAAPIWLLYMQEYLKNQKPIQFKAPEDIVFEYIDSKSGKIVNRNIVGAKRMPFVKNRLPEKLDTSPYIDTDDFMLENE